MASVLTADPIAHQLVPEDVGIAPTNTRAALGRQLAGIIILSPPAIIWDAYSIVAICCPFNNAAPYICAQVVFMR